MGTMDTAHTFTVTVGGNNLTRFLQKDSIKVSDAMAHEIDTCSLTLEDYTGSMSDADIWQEIIITDELAAKLFAGYVTRRKVAPTKSENTKAVTLYCQDYAVLLKTVIVYADYTDMTDEAIIDDLFTTYLPEITTTNVTASDGTYSFVFDNVTLLDAVKQIAKKARASWKVDYAKDVHYWAGDSPATAPFHLSDAPDFSTTYAFQKDTLQYIDDGESLVNRVVIQGGVGVSTEITDVFSGDGVTVEFNLSTRPIRDMVSITVGGVYQTYDTDFVIDDFIDKGGYLVDCLVNYHRGRVRWDGATPPAAGVSNISITYRNDEQVTVTRNQVESQVMYGRIFTRKITDKDLSTVAEAEAFGDAYLAEHAIRRRTGKVSVERYGLSSGEAMRVTCAAIGLDGSLGYGEGGYGEDGYGGDNYVLQTVGTEFGEWGVRHNLEFAEFQPSLSTMVATLAGGGASSGGVPVTGGGGSSGSHGAVGMPDSSGHSMTSEARRFQAGVIEALSAPGTFQWDDYGTNTGVVFGLDTSRSICGKLLVLEGGDVFGGFGDLKGHYGYVASTVALGLGEYGVSECITVDVTNGIRFLDTSGTALLSMTGDLFYLDGEIRVGDTGTPGDDFNGIRIYKSGATYRVEGQSAGAVQAYMGADGKLYWDAGAGVLDSAGITAVAGTIGGFTLGATTLTGGTTHIILDASNKKISIKDATYGNDGIQLDYNAGNPRCYVGDGADQYFQFDGTNVSWKGTNTALTAAGAFTASNAILTGTLSAASGDVVLNADGVTIAAATSYPWSDKSAIKWETADADTYAAIAGYDASGLMTVRIEANDHNASGAANIFLVANAGPATYDSAYIDIHASDPLSRGYVDIGADDYIQLVVGAAEIVQITGAGSAAATEQDWIEVTVGGVTGYVRVYATK